MKIDRFFANLTRESLVTNVILVDRGGMSINRCTEIHFVLCLHVLAVIKKAKGVSLMFPPFVENTLAKEKQSLAW